MRRSVVFVLLLIFVILGATQLFAALDKVHGYCTLPATSGISITITKQGGGSYYGSTNSSGYYSVNMSGASSGTYYFHPTPSRS